MFGVLEIHTAVEPFSEWSETFHVLGIEDEGVYSGEVVIEVSSGTAYLNGDLLAKGERVSCVGHHVLLVSGKNGYEKTVRFTITSGLVGVEDGGVYEYPVTLFFAGEGHLNGVAIATGETITESGEHVLSIDGENAYEETTSFTIESNQESTTSTLMIVEFVLIAVAVVLIGGLVVFMIIKNGKKRTA